MSGVDTNTRIMLHCNRAPGLPLPVVGVTGTPDIQTSQKKFGSASVYVDGSENLLIADSANFDFAAGPFTVDGWVRFTAYMASGTNGYLAAQYSTAGDRGWACGFGNSGGETYLKFVYTVNGTTAVVLNGPNTAIATTQWHHVAYVRSADNFTMYLNGTSAGSTSLSGVTIFSPTISLSIGGVFAANFLNAHLDDVRISKGLARWSGNFTPPTEAVISDTKTDLILHFDRSDAADNFYDGAGGNENGIDDEQLVVVGSPTVTTAESKFAGASLRCTTGAFYTFPAFTGQNFAATDFTIDCWVYPLTITTGTAQGICGAYDTANDRWVMGVQSAGSAFLSASSDGNLVVSIGKDVATGTWSHVAFVRAGTVGTFYVNGVGTSTEMTLAMPTLTGTLSVGARYLAASHHALNGYIDEFRLSHTARWTSDFTPPIAQYDTLPDTASVGGYMSPNCGYWGGY